MTTIRDANLDDPQRLVELFSDAYSGPSAKQAVPEAIWRDVDPLVRVREQLLGDLGMLVDRMSSPKNRMRVATRDHKVIGFAIWELDLKFDASTALGAGHRAEEPKKVTSKAVPGLNVALKQEVRDKIVAFQREVGARHGANELCDWLMVSPDAQHSGVGGALLRDGERLWPDVPHFLTAVSTALEYYPKQCFQVYRPRLEYNQGEVFMQPMCKMPSGRAIIAWNDQGDSSI